ncbi:ornithine carbamoyltransferase [Streptomyces clavuligerus]|uniref:Ornithine carbamoyltransferase n=1 Tax=Streptomyces clavuligerus TaxID=1901 RepID=B5GRY6_STRCL|nr:ornithine carbamoyltransferase [Streptomyces clavuligerus]EDY49082.1 ornithine carbamoyltransferase [Streptomyces clavuligerus]EFG03779.1 Ornithine carbamoyltransferase [Streptomyces clavuligerus]MBY6307691.1 ornithine carbamoyltransferase [Streptomyces clavuligerus]QCS09762.1 ornithine carbamoyltransferase [Streptomyces clavuligerus]QPJ98194.1 ornithine carbamoyltransferase [Streptomyces clavuligerus]
MRHHPAPVRHLLSLNDLTDEELYTLVDRAHAYARGTLPRAEPLAGRVVGTYFRTTSTRTRTAFSVAALRLGARVVAYGPGDLQENTGESADDTGRVLGLMLDGLVARTSSAAAELRTIASWNSMSVVNAMTEDEHPTQAVTDLSAMLTVLGRLEGLRVLYVGEGNNTAAALALALPRYRDTELYLRTPPGYGLPQPALGRAGTYAAAHRALVEERHDMDGLPDDVDVVYTTRWQTTGTAKHTADWRETFAPFRVDAALMKRYPGAVFLHDLPAHRGEEVDAEVLDGDRSVAFQQAAHKLHGAMSVLEWCLADRTDQSGQSDRT